MGIMRLISILMCFAFLIVNPFIFFAFQKVSTKVTVYDDIFLTESGLLPLPDNAVELDVEFSIPENHFTVAQKIAADSEGNIYVSDKNKCTVFKFNATGEFLFQIGQKGKRKGSFLSPYKILVEKDSLIIQDREKKSLEFMNFRGDHLKSLKISDFNDIVSDGAGLLYTAPYVMDKKSPLVKVYSSKGKLLYTFGRPLSFHHSIQTLNSRTMTLNEKGELFIAFSYFPLVRKYSSKGDLLAEFKIESLIMEAKEKYNLKKVGQGIADMSDRAGYIDVIVDVEALDSKVYLLSHYPRLEILEIDIDGKVTVTYWKDFQNVYKANDFLIQEIDGKKRFYVLQTSPPKYDVDVFRAKKKREKGDVKSAVEDFTKTIEANPDYFQAYYNRGLVKYSIGDFEGAIEDFSTALEKKPDYHEAFYYRGISKRKIRDFDGAFADFTRVIELNPTKFEAYINRGNLLARQGAHEKAVNDYTQAVMNAPDSTLAYNNRGLSKVEIEDFEGALHDFTRVIELDPQNAEAFFNRGNCRLDNEEHDKAIEDYNKAIEINPEYSNAYYNRGIARINKRDFKVAISDFEKAARLDSKLEKDAQKQIKYCLSRLKK